jgi:hypothetical protein
MERIKYDSYLTYLLSGEYKNHGPQSIGILVIDGGRS